MRVVRILIALGALKISAPPVCAKTIAPGEFFTYDQFEYGTNSRLEEPNNPQAAALLEDNFDTVYAPFEDLLHEWAFPARPGIRLIFDSPRRGARVPRRPVELLDLSQLISSIRLAPLPACWEGGRQGLRLTPTSPTRAS